MVLSVFIVFVLSAICLPADGWAWGPSTHVQLGLSVLEQLHLLPVTLRELLTVHGHNYLYGCVSADIIVGKRFIDYRYHCHNWAVGLQLLKKARKRSLRAFVYGYLSHLAADTVAHNIFVPQKLVESFRFPSKGHLYWESVYDRMVTSQKVLDIVYTMSKDHFEEEDNFLRDSLTPTLFSFATNKRLFNSFLLLQRFRRWQKLVEKAVERNKVPIQSEEVEFFTTLNLNAILGFLIDQRDSRYVRLDPTGTHALRQAELYARHLKQMRRQGGKRGAEDLHAKRDACMAQFKQEFAILLGNGG